MKTTTSALPATPPSPPALLSLALPCALTVALSLALWAAAPGAQARQVQPPLQQQQVQQQPPAAGRQDLAALRQTVEQFLLTQIAGLPGQATVTVGAIDQRMALAPCPQMQAFFMPGARAWGKTTVGVRCAAPSPWTVYIQANVAVQAHYVASAVPLAQGQPIEAGQLVLVKGDLTTLPAGIATDIGQIVGRSSTMSLAAGTPMRLDTVRSKTVIQAGQLVRVVSGGAGFRVSAEARAVANAGEGQPVQVRTAGGQQVSGIAKAGGLVEVAF